MIFDDVLDTVEEDYNSRCGKATWFRHAMNALTAFLSENGKNEFTSSEFRRWASYYCDLDDPHEVGPWSSLFNTARSHDMIRKVGLTRSSHSEIKPLWAAA